jgi:hypothetical protein
VLLAQLVPLVLPVMQVPLVLPVLLALPVPLALPVLLALLVLPVPLALPVMPVPPALPVLPVLLTLPAPLAICRRSSLRRVGLVVVLVLPVLVLVLVPADALARKILRWPKDTRGLPGLARQERRHLQARRGVRPRPPQRTIR